MRDNLFIYIAALLFVAGLTSCDPTRFSVLSDRDVDCRIYSDHRLVKKHSSGFTMYPGACVGATYLWATQYLASFRLTVEDGDGVEVMLRPIVEEQVLDSGIVLSLSKGGYQLRSKDTILASGTHPILAKGVTQIFRAYSEEGYLELTLGCDTLFKGITKRIEGDDIIFSPIGQSTVTVFAPLWRDIEYDLLGREQIWTGSK